MAHPTKPPEVESDNANFPLDAYMSKALHTPSNVRHSTTKRPHLHGLGAAVGAVLWAWFAYIVMLNMARIACFNSDAKSMLSPPGSICRLVHPTPAQFWQLVFSDNEPPALDHGAHIHISYIRQLLAIPRRQDFALRAFGASITPEFTSPTYSPAGQKLRPIDSFGMHLPTIMLEEQVLIGDCWEFEGSSGRIGVHLPDRINLTAMSVTYPDPRTLSMDFQKRAPRSITLWALVEGTSLSRAATAGELTSLIRQPQDLAISSRLPSQFISNSYFLPLIQARYEPSSQHPLQSFVRDPALDQLSEYRASFFTQDIVVEVESNWGGRTTCLHHIGIHGDRAT